MLLSRPIAQKLRPFIATTFRALPDRRRQLPRASSVGLDQICPLMVSATTVPSAAAAMVAVGRLGIAVHRLPSKR